jgi:hypothetical protein
MAAKVKRLIIDSQKPLETPKLDLTLALCFINGIEGVILSVMEVDLKTETIRLLITGQDMLYERVQDVLSNFRSAVRSIDEIEVKRE